MSKPRPKPPDDNDLKRMDPSGYNPLDGTVPHVPESPTSSPPDSEPPTGEAQTKPRKRATQIHRMLDLFAEHNGEAFLSIDERPFVSFVSDGQKMVLSLSAAVGAVGQWLYKASGEPSTARLREQLKDHLTAMAHSAPRRKVWLRVAEADDCLYLDLARDDGQVVKVSPDGWELTGCPPVNFHRSPGMLPLPIPEHGGYVAELFDYVNVPDDASRALVLGWLVSTLKPSLPAGILAIHGEQGCAKSTLARVLSRLIDPQSADLRTRPKDEEIVMLATRNAWILPYDNLSGMAVWLSEILCCVSTGGSLTRRKHYSNDEELVIHARCPVILTGIEDVATRPDFADRSIVLHLSVIPRERRKTETELLDGFGRAHPRILGALLSAAADGLRRLPHTHVKAAPRTADFTRWAVATQHGLGLPAGAFLIAYEENRRTAQATALACSPLVEPIEKLMASCTEWSGTAADLLDALAELATEAQLDRQTWPKDATRLSGQLRRIGPPLRSRGLDIQLDVRAPGGMRHRMMKISKAAP